MSHAAAAAMQELPVTRRATIAASPFPWFGGKQGLAPKIVALLPPHASYVEPFGGAASVLLSKPLSKLEVYNDLDSGLVNFFRVLRDRGDELYELLRLTPYAREEFDHCVETWEACDDELERARRWYVRVAQAYGGTPTSVGWSAEKHARSNGPRGRAFANRVNRLDRYIERMRLVQIEHLDYRDVFDRYDGPGVVFYLDPPYPHSTRGRSRHRGGCSYVFEMSEPDHQALVERVLELRGIPVISGYDHAAYNRLEEHGFERIEFEVCLRARVGAGTVAQARTEVIWRRGDHERLF